MDELKTIIKQKIDWQKSDESEYIFTAMIDGKNWKLRLNDFPEEPLCTVIWEGGLQDLDDLGEQWTLPKHRGE
ncbi:hypothetical protein ACFLRB_06365 [Acidobacteriota bacterium]